MSNQENEIIVIAGNWEPMAFEIRRGSSFINEEERYACFHSEKLVEQLHDIGATVAIWHGYKGLGINHERVEWEHLKPFRKLLEKYNIEMGAYLQCGSYFAETFYEEVPEAREWTALDYWGKPQVYSEYYRSYYRHRPCQTYTAFSEYVAQAGQILAREYGVTFFYADNNAQMPCYTPRFTQAFHQFLKDKYATGTPEGQARFIKRYGVSNPDNIVLPCGTARRPIEALHALPDPGLQDWVEFRCRLTAGNAKIISAGVKSANPQARLCYNLSYDGGEFGPLIWGVEPESLSPYADFLFSEDGNHPRVTQDDRLISQFHTCKHLRAMGQRGHFHAPALKDNPSSRQQAVLSIMELAVLNQGCIGSLYFSPFEMVENDPRPGTVRFIQKHKEIFTQNSTVSQIAVLRGRHAGALNWLQATEGRMLAEQALYQAGLQFDNVIESTLDQLDKYSLLILPETISIPETCVKQIAEYVRKGGRVLTTGEALARNERGQRKPKGTAVILQGECNRDYGCATGGNYDKMILAAWLGLNEEAQQRIFVFPRLLHPSPHIWDPNDSRTPMLDSSYHALPLNHVEFINSVIKALPEAPIVQMDASNPYVIPALLQSKKDGRLSLHMLNYRPAEKVPPRTIRVCLPKGTVVKQTEYITLENNQAEELAFEHRDGVLTMTLPAFSLYLGVIL